MACVQWFSAPSAPPAQTSWPGFTAVGRLALSVDHGMEFHVKVSDGSEPANYSVTTSTATQTYVGYSIIDGADTTTPQQDNASFNSYTSASSSSVVPSVTPTNDGSCVIAGCAPGTGGAITETSPYTQAWDVSDGWSGGYYNQATEAATGTSTWTHTSAYQGITGALIIQPAGAGGGPQTWDFTGANGAAWPSPWTKTSAGTTTVDIQSNRGRLLKGTTAWDMAQATYGAAQHFEIAGEVYPTSIAAQHWIIMRLRETGGNTYYSFEMDPSLTTGNVYLKRWAAGVDQGQIAGSASNVAFSTSAGRSFRLRVAGPTLKYRTWVTGNTEPTTWDVEVTDSNITASGQLRIEITDGTTVARSVSFDNMTFEEIDPYDLTMIPTGVSNLSGFSGAYTAITADDGTYLEPV